MGPELGTYIGTVKPALMSAIDAEFQRNPHDGSAEPKRVARCIAADNGQVVGGKGDAAGGGGAGASGGGGSGNFDSFPREDISEKLPPVRRLVP